MNSEVSSYLSKLLLRCGDVETNPRPDLSHLSKQIQQLADDVKEIKNTRLASIENKLDQVTAIEGKLASCMNLFGRLQESVAAMERKLDELDNRSRRSNLIIYGIPENDKGNEKDLDVEINKKIISNVLKLEPIAIERIHRLGKPATNKMRPVILKLLDFHDKNKILQNCSKLKGSSFAIGEDFSPRVREIRRNLWKAAKVKRATGDKVSLVYDKLKINNDLFSWDEESNCIRPAFRSSHQKNAEAEMRTLRPRNNPPRMK